MSLSDSLSTLWVANLLLISKCVSLDKTEERNKLFVYKVSEGWKQTDCRRKVYTSKAILSETRWRQDWNGEIRTDASAKPRMSCTELALISHEYIVSIPDISCFSLSNSNLYIEEHV